MGAGGEAAAGTAAFAVMRAPDVDRRGLRALHSAVAGARRVREGRRDSEQGAVKAAGEDILVWLWRDEGEDEGEGVDRGAVAIISVYSIVQVVLTCAVTDICTVQSD